MQTAVNKVIRVGRATVLAIGVGVVVALVLGLATVALAAVPGDPFRLGQVNVINNATTALRGNGPSGNGLEPLLEVKREGTGFGPALRVENTNTGIIGGKGIEVKVGPGKEPIRVNPDAGKSNLNVDRLDGKTEEDFLSASRIYGGSALKTGTGGTVSFTALDGLRCDEGDVAINGGANANDTNDTLNNITPFGGSYQIEFKDNPPTGSTFRANIICSDSAKPFRD